MANGSIWSVPATVAARSIDNALEDFFRPTWDARSLRRGGDFVPALDVWEDEERYGLAVEVPGFKMNDIDVVVHGEEVIISGKKLEEKDEVKGSYRHKERVEGSFKRSVRLPGPISVDAIEAKLANGVLDIKLPKAETAKAKKVQVSEA